MIKQAAKKNCNTQLRTKKLPNNKFFVQVIEQQSAVNTWYIASIRFVLSNKISGFAINTVHVSNVNNIVQMKQKAIQELHYRS